jgi:glycosyltransferase involved in cell wall biosynthesis
MVIQKLDKRVTGVTAHRPKKVLQSYMRQAWNVHANSILLLEELRAIVDHKRVYYVPNGVDEKLFRPIEPLGEGSLLVAGHVGKECPQKKQTSIIQPAINEAGVESFYNLNDYTTRVPYCEMYRQYQEMDVFIVASIEDGTPNGALEAAACGRPIISNKIGNMPEFIVDGYNGFIVDMNTQAYVEKLKYLNENRDKLREMGKNARTTVEQGWTWKIQAENYRKMFRSIIGK